MLECFSYKHGSSNAASGMVNFNKIKKRKDFVEQEISRISDPKINPGPLIACLVLLHFLFSEVELNNSLSQHETT